MPYTIYRSDGTPITIADAVVNSDYYSPNANGTGKGLGVQFIGNGVVDYSAPIAQTLLQITENFAGTVRPADDKSLQGQLWFNRLSDSSGDLYVKTGTTPGGGLANWTKLSTGGSSYTLPPATNSVLGGIKVGSGLTITGDGTLSATGGGGGGSGTVTSVGLSMPTGFTVGSSPVTSAGTISVGTTLNGILAGTGTGFATVLLGSGLTYDSGSRTLSATGGGGMTYSISALDDTNAASIVLTGSDGSTDSVLLKAGANVTISSTNANTIVIAASGGGGGAGYQSASVVIYQWAATQPALPNYSSEYTWATGEMSSVPVNWSLNPPATPPTTGWALWAITVRLTAAAGDATTVFNWNTGAIAQISAPGTPGTPGSPGNIYNTAYLYQWAPVQPSNPNGNSTWTWASGAHSNYTGGNGWNLTIPTNPGTAGLLLWTAAKEISAAGGTVSSTIDWTDGIVTVSAVGQNGAEGPAGVKTGVATVYQWSLPPAPSISGTSTFNWATGKVTADPAGGWFVASTSAPGQGFYLYEARVNLTAASAATTSTVDWATASISIAGYSGINGSGSSAPSSVLAYARIANNPQPVSGTYQTTGLNSLPSGTGTWGTAFNTTWYASDPDPASNASLYVCSGIYDPATDKITWTTPYLASLRVGNLSAITTNTGDLSVTGTITAGNAVPGLPVISGTTMTGQGAVIYSSGNFAMGNPTTNISFNGTQMTLNGNVVYTQNIQENAVTAISGVSASDSIPLDWTAPVETDVLSTSQVSMVTGGSFILFTSLRDWTPGIYCVASGGEGSNIICTEYPMTVRIYRNNATSPGNTRQTLIYQKPQNYSTETIIDTPGNGSFFYTMTAITTGQGDTAAGENTVRYRSMVVLGAKR